MESKRQQKVNKLIHKDMSDIFQKEASHLVLGSFVTVTQVKITPDLGQAKVYLSFILDKNKELILDQIRENTNMIRSALGARVRHQLRVVPVLQFYLDDTAEYVEKIEKLFEGIVIPSER